MTGNVTDERDIYIRRMCCSSVVAIAISVACMVVGCLSIVESAPKYLFPYCLGGSAIAGVFVMVLASCHIKLYCNYLENGRVHGDEDTIKRWAFRQILLISLTSIALIVGLGISGIWGMVKATDVINFEAKFNLTSIHNVPYAKDNLVYAICSFVFMLALSLVQIYLWCTCLCYTDTYGFTDNTMYSYSNGYERRNYAQSLIPARTSAGTTNESRPNPQAVTHSGPYTGTLGINRTNDNGGLRVNIQRFRDGQGLLPFAPSIPHDYQNDRPSTTRNLPADESVDATTRGTDTSSDRQPPPPQYEQIFGEPPPSYSQVMIEGSFQVTYV